MTDQRDRPVLTGNALREAEMLIGEWDQEGGMSYRQLAARLFEIFAEEKVAEIGA
jgi:hypothetical protein